MQLEAKTLLTTKRQDLDDRRKALARQPGLALIWVGDDAATATFVRVKKLQAETLDCQFFLHQFTQAENRQLEALIKGLNVRKDIDGIVLQLPLPAEVDRAALIATIDPIKDIDDLQATARYSAPTAQGIVDLLLANHVDLAKLKTVIIGDGLLVGRPLAAIFTKNNWPFTQINRRAEESAATIRQADLVISCTGVKSLITPAMVHQKMIVVDGTGVDVDVKQIEPLVKLITSAKGAIGPLTVTNLFSNLLMAAASHIQLQASTTKKTKK